MADADGGYVGVLEFEGVMVFEFAGEVEVAAAADDFAEDGAAGTGADGGSFDFAGTRADDAECFGIEALADAGEHFFECHWFFQVAETSQAGVGRW